MDNLPPGVTVNMIPGNTDKDRRWELYLEKHCPDFDDLDEGAQAVVMLQFEEDEINRHQEDY